MRLEAFRASFQAYGGLHRRCESKLSALESTKSSTRTQNFALTRELELKTNELGLLGASQKSRTTSLGTRLSTLRSQSLADLNSFESQLESTLQFCAASLSTTKDDLATAAKREKVELRAAQEESRTKAERVRSLEQRLRELSVKEESRISSENSVASKGAGASLILLRLRRSPDEASCAGFSSSYSFSATYASTTLPSFADARSDENAEFVLQQLVSTIERLNKANVSLRSENSSSLHSSGT